MVKRGKSILGIGLCFILAVSILASFVSAYSDLNNYQNKDGVSDKIAVFDNAKAELITPKINYVMPGQNRRVMIFNIENFGNVYTNGLNEMEIFNLNQNGARVSKNFHYEYAIYGNVPKYRQVCNEIDTPKGPGQDCSMIQDGTTYNIIRWEDLTSTNIPTGNITIALVTDVASGDHYDGIPILFNKRVDKWAEWTEALNVDLEMGWNMENESASSTNIVDVVTKFNNLTFSGNPTWIAGKINEGINLDGTGDYTFLNSASANVSVYPWTYSCWIKTNTHVNYAALFLQGTDTDAYYLEINLGDGTGRMNVLFWNTGLVNLNFNSGLNVGDWHHIVIKRNETMVYEYTDNIEKLGSNIGTNNAQLGSQRIILGMRANNGAQYNGEMDECYLWSRDLTISEIEQLYNNGTGITYTNIFDVINPETTTPIITPTQPTSSNNLECYATLTDNKQTNITTYWKWYKNNALNLSGTSYALNNTYTKITNLSSVYIRKGENWSCEITPFDGYNNGTTKISANVTILNSVPTQATPVLSTPSANHPSNENLTCSNISTSDIDKDNIINIYNWIKNSVSILSLNVPFESNINDYSGNGNDGTNNGATIISGKLGKSISLNGNDNITFSDDNSLDFTNEKTWEIWVKRDITGAEIIFDKGNGTKSNYKLEFLSNNLLKFSYSLALGNVINLLQEDTKTEFDEGIYNDVYYNATIEGIRLTEGKISGNYTSKIFDASSVGEWNNISWSDNIGAVLTLVDVNEGIYKSTDQGASWILINESYGGAGSAVEIIESINGILYIVNSREEVWRSEDFGKSWIEQVVDFNGAETTTAMTMTGDANYLYIIEDDEDVWRSSNDGVNWTKVNDDLDSGTSTSDIMGVAMDSSGAIFTVADDAKVYKSINNGTDWNEIEDDYNSAAGNFATDLNIDYDDNLFILNMQEIWESTDSGISWTKVNADFNGVDSNNGITMTSDINRFLYIVDTSEDVYRSTDDGTSWNLLISNVNGVSGDIKSIVAYDQPTTKFKVRSCDDSSCSGESFIGPDETSSSYYLSSPYNLNVSDNQYFQYIAYFSTYDLDYSPQLYAVDTTYTTQSTDLETSLTSSTAITDTNWNHVVISFDNTNENNFKMYINGSLDANTTETRIPGFNSNPLILGDGFDGNLDEFKIYNIALTPEQINAYYNLKYNTWVSQETSASEKYTCSVTPNDGTSDGTKLTSNEIEILVSITFNVTDSYSNTKLDYVIINCNYTEFNQAGDNTNPYGPYGFNPGIYSCEFSQTDSGYYNKTIIFTANEDKIINIPLSKEGYLTPEEHTWLEGIYNCVVLKDCDLYNLLLEINQTTGNIWENTKPTDSSVVLYENITNKVVSSSSNLTINYTVSIPIKAGYALGTYLPVRIGFWFLDENNQTCYNQGDKPTGVEDPYCQPLVVETIGPMGGSTSFVVKLQPSLPTGNYNVKRIIDIDPNNIWINYGQETVGVFRVSESLNNPNINLQKTSDTMPAIQTNPNPSANTGNTQSSSGGGGSSSTKEITNVYNTYNTFEQEPQASSEDGIIHLDSNSAGITGGVIGTVLSNSKFTITLAILCGTFIVFILCRTIIKIRTKTIYN